MSDEKKDRGYMRALIQSTVAWVNQKIVTTTAHEESSEVKPTPAVVNVTPPAPVPHAPPLAPKAKAVRPSLHEEVVAFQPIITTEGPELVLTNKGSKLYGTCPHCSATWSVAERLMHPRFQRLDKSKGLTCPACDKLVSLPAKASR